MADVLQGELDLEETPKTKKEIKAEKQKQKKEEEKAKKDAEKAKKEEEKQAKAEQKKQEREEKKAEREQKTKEFIDSINPFSGITNVMTMASELTEEEKATLNKEAEEEQAKDVSKLKDETSELEKENVEENKKSAENQIKAMEDLLKKRIDLMDNSPIYNELPRTIRQAYKSGKFGEVMTDDLRNQYRAEMKKPISERDTDILEKYKNAKDAQHARNYFILDAISTGLTNVGSALQGGQGGKETKWNQLQGSRIADAQHRYKDLLDTKANEVIKSAENAGIMNRENEKALRTLYQDRRLQPLLNKLDVDTQTQLLRLIDQKAGALSFETFINALALQLMNDPKGTVSGVFGAFDKLK